MSGRGKVTGHVFISYVREDSDRVDQLQRSLQAAGVPVWRDTADLWPGEDWRSKIRSAITDNALVFIACFSQASVGRYKSYQNEELALAIEQLRLRPPDEPWLIPIRFDECEVPDRDIGGGRTLASIQRADLFAERFDEGTARLVAAILRILGRHPDTHAAAGHVVTGPAMDRLPDAPRWTMSGHWESEDYASAQRAITGLAPRPSRMIPRRYVAQIPPSVTTAFFAKAKTPLARAEPLYRDVASDTGIPWELLAACDWMQCQADPRRSSVVGERLGYPNPYGTVYMTKSEALGASASDLIELSAAVYKIDLTAPHPLSVIQLANAFAAFRWGALLRRHAISSMEFPYSVAGLTAQHLKMCWPNINDPDAPDRPGTRFRKPFGAVPVVLCLNYEAAVD